MGASNSLTIKQETFCKKYIENGGNASAAYRHAYAAEGMKPQTIHVKAYELMRNGKITVRLNELKLRQMQRHDVTIDGLTQELEELRRRAFEDGKYSAAVSSVMGIARLHGLDLQRTQVAIRHETTPQERTAILQNLLSRATVLDKNSAPQP